MNLSELREMLSLGDISAGWDDCLGLYIELSDRRRRYIPDDATPQEAKEEIHKLIWSAKEHLDRMERSL